MKLSVIIPVYNVENYIQECLDSLLKQQLEEVEVILVDDGSIDNSISLAKEKIQNQPHFQIIHKKNGGLSDARNYGVQKSCGEYLFFLDSDDTIAEGTLKDIVQALKQENPDLLVFDMLFEWENSDQKKVVPGYLAEQKDTVKALLRATPSACNKIFKREFILEHPFPYGMFYEDLATVPMIYTELGKVVYLNQPYYRYRQREGSIIYTFNKKTLDVFTCFDRILNHYQISGTLPAYREELEFLLIEHLMLYANRRFINSTEAKQYLKMANDYINHWFKDWKKNIYLKQMSKNDQLFIRIASFNNAKLLRGMIQLKQRLKGGV